MTHKFTYIVLILICLSAKTWGQSVTLVSTSKGNDIVYLSMTDITPTARWEIGRQFYAERNTTIRHSVHKGNGNNIAVNSKLPYRLLIAPMDLNDTYTWAEAMNCDLADNSNMNANPTKRPGNDQSGCAKLSLSIAGYSHSDIKWRVPTQRELTLIWLLREPIQQAFNTSRPGQTGIFFDVPYWSSTETDANNACYFDMTLGNPVSGKAPKSNRYRIRCVADFY